jgi:hypothetical protein
MPQPPRRGPSLSGSKPDLGRMIRRLVRAQHAARQATSDARDVRTSERHAARAVEAARQAADHAEKAVEPAAREAEERDSAAHIAARAVALEAERKAQRDARYAARKSRR